MPAPAGRTFRELYRASRARRARMNAPHEPGRRRAEALAPRRVARHGERVRRAGRGQRAGPRRARTSCRSASGSPISRRRATSRTPAIAAIKAGKHGYTPSAGIDELRAAAAKDIGARRGLDIPARGRRRRRRRQAVHRVHDRVGHRLRRRRRGDLSGARVSRSTNRRSSPTARCRCRSTCARRATSRSIRPSSKRRSRRRRSS